MNADFDENGKTQTRLETERRHAGLDLFPDSTGKEINEDWLRVFGIRIRLPYGDARAWSDWAKVAGESV